MYVLYKCLEENTPFKQNFFELKWIFLLAIFRKALTIHVILGHSIHLKLLYLWVFIINNLLCIFFQKPTFKKLLELLYSKIKSRYMRKLYSKKSYFLPSYLVLNKNNAGHYHRSNQNKNINFVGVNLLTHFF